MGDSSMADNTLSRCRKPLAFSLGRVLNPFLVSE